MARLSLQCRHRFAGGFEMDLAFECDRRLTAMFGPSGSGKTTLLSVVAGLLRPDHGLVRAGDRTLLDTQARICLPPEQRGIGVVFQDSLLFEHLSVEGNLRFGQRRRRKPFRKVAMADVVEVLQIGPLLSRHPQALSGGERQRVALGRALLSGPEILILDEPLASLDDALKDRVLDYLERIVAHWDIPTLFVTHSQAEVRRAADWVIVIERGRLVTQGAPEDALSQPGPLAYGNSAAPVNLLRLEEVDQTQEIPVARLGKHLLTLPPRQGPMPRPCFVQCSPTDVLLSLAPIEGISARNQWQGQICQIVPVGEAMFVAVDIGQILWAEVTRQAARELDLAPGRTITCLVKAHSLSYLND